MCKSYQLLAGMVGLVLVAAPLRAADELYSIKLFQPEKPGNTQDVHFVIEQQSDTTMASPNRDPHTTSRLLKADLTGRTRTLQVDEAGSAKSILFSITKLTRPDGGNIIKPGALVDITRTPADSTCQVRGGADMSDDATAVLKLLFPKLPHAGEADRVFGSATPRKAGEQWELNAKAASEMLAADGLDVAPKDVHGQTSIKGVETVHGTKALRLLTTMSVENAKLSRAQPGIQINGCEMTTTMSILQPVDMTLPPLEMTTKTDLTIRLFVQASGLTGETKSHISVAFSGTIVEKPTPVKTASAAPQQ